MKVGLVRRLLVIGVFGVSAIFVSRGAAQAFTQSSDIKLYIQVTKQHYQAGEKPWTVVTVENVGKKVLTFEYYRVHVDGEDGEAPMTLFQRQITGRVNAGEHPIVGGSYAGPYVGPGAENVQKYDLSAFYDLSKPGKYTVYVELLGLRSPEATFEVDSKQ